MEDYRGHLVITVAEAAEWLRTSEEAILKLAEDGLIPAVRYTPDDPPVFRPEDIVAFVERQSASRQPSGLFGVGYRFAPMDVRGVVMPPVPPTPPTPPRPPTPSVFAFAPRAAPGFEYAFTSHEVPDPPDPADWADPEHWPGAADTDALRQEADALRAEADALRDRHETLTSEMDKMREELRKIHEQRDR